ncbi:hypothetical protein F4801DRAFT_579189 [Xylaria longipes]|nr:hypothetical protein F4801DRAFT_579189 [Xylaria longipes]
MYHRNINMNAVSGDDENPCIDPALLMNYTTQHLDTIGDTTGINDTTPYIYQNVLMYNTTEQQDVIRDDTLMNFQPPLNIGPSNGEPPTDPKIIQCKLFFLIAAHKKVQTGKEFVAVARITRGHENPFVNAQGMAYHYVPEIKHQQFNTSTLLTNKELAEAEYDDRAFAVHKKTGTSCAPAGTYMVYRLKRSEPGLKNLRFEAIWDWGDGFIGKASYDFVFLTAHDDCTMKPYTTLQKKLLNELWPEWEKHIDCGREEVSNS